MPKRFCAARDKGCPVKLTSRHKGEFCEEHTCTAYSVSYGQCILGKTHQDKHMNKEGDEWG